MGDLATQKKLIEKFVRHLSQLRNCELQISEVPDEINRNEKDIDALIEGPGFRIALEHTSIDSVPGQREENAKYRKYIFPIYEELKDTFVGRVRVILPILYI